MKAAAINLEYTILKKSSIIPNVGSMDNIVQKNSDGVEFHDIESFDFEIKLKTKAIVQLIEYKAMFGEQIVFELFEDNSKVIDSA